MGPGLPGWSIPAVILASLLVFLWIETRRPLRRMREPKLRRMGRNLAVAGLGFAVIELLQIPILVPVSSWTMDRRIGLWNRVPLHGGLRIVACFLLLDYTLWWWHRMNHQIPFFWRFHSVHHVDRDMDASTALRFHFGELGFSVVFRALQIVAIGADPLSVSIYQACLFASILFHHSNSRLPLFLERALVRVIVTPRMHGIHHSDYRNETDSNWASLLSAWDYLHSTIRLDVPHDRIEIGVPAYQDPARVTLAKILAMPFRRRGDDWARADGSPAVRAPFSSQTARLTE